MQHLQETGVGRTVNALRKEPGDVGTAARALVNKWKLMVASEETSDPEDHAHDSMFFIVLYFEHSLSFMSLCFVHEKLSCHGFTWCA